MVSAKLRFSFFLFDKKVEVIVNKKSLTWATENPSYENLIKFLKKNGFDCDKKCVVKVCDQNGEQKEQELKNQKDFENFEIFKPGISICVNEEKNVR